MTVQLTQEQEAVILETAERDGKSPAEVLTDAAEWLQSLAGDEEEQRILDERTAQADRGDFLTKEEMDARFQGMLKPR